jgi:hypothetical protein
VACSSESGKEPLYSINDGEFIDQSSDYQLVMENSAPLS